MDKKEIELRQALREKRDKANELTNEGKTEEARSVLDEAKGIKDQIELLAEARDMEPPQVEGMNFTPQAGEPTEGRNIEGEEAEYRSAFMKAIRGKGLTQEERQIIESRAMTEGSDEDGGYTVPQDIQTKINELKRQTDSLEQYVKVEPVNTRSGSRVLEKSGEMTPFADLGEMDELDEMENPQFTQLKYAISNRGGFLPISNDLLKDTAENLMNYLANWIAKKSIVTRNKLILDVLDNKNKETFSKLDDIKKSINVNLDPAIASSAIVLTNQDGFNYLDNLKDGNGNYVLQPDPKDPTKKLFVGKPVVVISNKYLETKDKKAPMIVGDLTEAVVLFDRQAYSVDMTDVGGKAWRTNSTEVRAIEREDVQAWDDDAIIYGQVAV